MSRTATDRIDYTSKDYESFRMDMVKSLREKMPEYTDIRQSDAGIVILELLAQGLDILSYYQDVMANEAFLVSAEQRDNIMKWASILGYIPRNATAARLKQVFVLSAVQKQDVIIPAMTVVKTKKTVVEPEVVFETEKSLTIPAGCLGNEKDENGEYLYSVNVVQGTSVLNECCGSSIGVANQKFILNYFPVISDSISVLVNEGIGFETWTRVETFVDSLATSQHYTLSLTDNNEGVLTFGNGVFGKIPKAFENGIYCSYRVGGGEIGNVSANKITVLENNIALIKSTFNPETPFEYGYDKETLTEIKNNAPKYSRTIWGAITLEDFEIVLKMNFPEIKFISAYLDPENIDNVWIYVYLENETPLTPELHEKMYDLFDINKGGRKIVGTGETSIFYAKFVELDLVCSLIVKDNYERNSVENKIKSFLEYYFKKGNYDFNKELSLSELSATVMNPLNYILGIRSFRFISPDVDILTPKMGEIYTLKSLTFNTTGGII